VILGLLCSIFFLNTCKSAAKPTFEVQLTYSRDLGLVLVSSVVRNAD